MATGHTSFWQQYESLEDELSSLDRPPLAKVSDEQGEQSRFGPSIATASLSHHTSDPDMTNCDTLRDDISRQSQLRAEITSFQKIMEPFYASGTPPPGILLSAPVSGASMDDHVAKLHQLCLDYQKANQALQAIPNDTVIDSMPTEQEQGANDQAKHSLATLESSLDGKVTCKVEPYSKRRLRFHLENAKRDNIRTL